jgi:DNA-binding transcriptional regulator YdaS (Cro superfamily)
MLSSRSSTLWFVAGAKYGGMVGAARAIGVHPNTLYKAAAGIGVSAESRRKIEAAFGVTLEELQEPLAKAAV